MNKIQYWKNGIMLTTVTKEESKEIMNNALRAGFRVYDCGHYFSVEDKDKALKGEVSA